MECKRELRKRMRMRRNEMSLSEKEQYDNAVFEKIIANLSYEKATVIFIYVSYNDEVDTHKIINHALSAGKTICVPKVVSKEMGMVAIKINGFDDLTPGAYGILEPSDNGTVIEPEKIDMVILPGLAFDAKGGRLGYGGGFYDRYLSAVKEEATKLALGYSFQIIDKVPTEEFDVLINEVITN